MRKRLQLYAMFGMCWLANSASALYICEGNGDLYSLDVSTNTSTFIGSSGVGRMYDIALNPLTNELFGVSGADSSLYKLDVATGVATLIGHSAFINGLAFDNAGTLYATGGANLYSIDTATGSANYVGGSMRYASSGDIAFDDAGNLYLSATSQGYDQLVSVDINTGAGTAIGSFGFSSVYGLSFVDSTLYGFTADGKTISIDTLTGAGTFVAYNGLSAFGADGAGGVVDVPEPSSLALIGVGLMVLGYSRRKHLQSGH